MLNSPDSKRQAVVDPALAAVALAAFAMITLAQARGGHHPMRIQHYIKALAQQLQKQPQLASVMTDSYVNVLLFSAPLHDLGTIGVPDWILLKPSGLTSTERAVMQTHTTLGRDAIEQVEKTIPYQVASFKTLKEMVYSHHEKWNGKGYPLGLSGEQIPFAARLLTIVDVYDGVTSNHVYQAGASHEEAVAIISKGRDTQFDPVMVDAFLQVQDEFQAIALHDADTELDMQKMIEYMANAIAEEAELPAL